MPNTFDQLNTPSQMFQQLTTTTEQFNSVLGDYTTSSINYNNNPNYPEYEQTYDTNAAIIQKLQADLFVTSNDVTTDIATLNGLISTLEIQIDAQKVLNAKLIPQVKQTLSTQNGSDLLIDENTELYKNQYLSNVTLGIGILLLFYTSFKVFKKQITH